MLGKKVKWIAIACALGALVLFQNCSELELKDDVLSTQRNSESQAALDAEALPRLLETQKLSFWRKPGATDFIGTQPLISDRASVIVAVDGTTTGTILGLVTNTTSVEDLLIEVDKGIVRVIRRTDASYYVYIESPVPAGDRYLVAVSFGPAANDLSLMINGFLQKSPAKRIGTPLEMAFILRQITLGTASEAMIYTDSLLDTELNVMSRFVANNQRISNVVFDLSLIDGSPSEEITPISETAEFLAAKAIIEAKCLNRHRTNNGNLSGLTQSKALSAGWVVAKNPEASKLYNRLIGSSGPGNKNMPMRGSISLTEVQVIATWINSIQ